MGQGGLLRPEGKGMHSTMKTLLEQMRITEMEIDGRKRLLEFDN